MKVSCKMYLTGKTIQYEIMQFIDHREAKNIPNKKKKS